jgi:ketosteroid isomerase-like protein
MTTTQEKAMTTQEIADRFYELAQQENWFGIQDEFFSDDVKSIEPEGSPYFGYAEGKGAVRKKGEDFVSRIESVHGLRTTAPIVAGNHFVVGREKDITVRPHGRININQVMLYEVRDGRIVKEQFFY